MDRRGIVRVLTAVIFVKPRRLVAKAASSTLLPAPATTTIAVPSVDVGVGLTVHPRANWVLSTWPTPHGLMIEETVNVVVVHHSETPNVYEAADVAARLRSIRGYHVSASKGWPDIAYNFLIDRFGGVWEGRAGSLAGAVKGSASDGNQGHSQLVCLIGDHRVEPPTAAALNALARLVAVLGDRYGLSPEPEVTTTFVSEGSSRWAVGELVTTRSIEGHRAMSVTSCPGNAAFALLPSIRLEVKRLRSSTRRP